MTCLFYTPGEIRLPICAESWGGLHMTAADVTLYMVRHHENTLAGLNRHGKFHGHLQPLPHLLPPRIYPVLDLGHNISISHLNHPYRHGLPIFRHGSVLITLILTV